MSRDNIKMAQSAFLVHIFGLVLIKDNMVFKANPLSTWIQIISLILFGFSLFYFCLNRLLMNWRAQLKRQALLMRRNKDSGFTFLNCLADCHKKTDTRRPFDIEIWRTTETTRGPCWPTMGCRHRHCAPRIRESSWYSSPDNSNWTINPPPAGSTVLHFFAERVQTASDAMAVYLVLSYKDSLIFHFLK